MSAPSSTIRLTLPGSGMMLLHPDRRQLFVFNRTAHLLWRVLHLHGRRCMPSALSARFDLPDKDARRDADAIFDQWDRLGLLSASTTIEPPAQRDAVFETPRESVRVVIGPLVAEFRAPPDVIGLLLSMWSHLCDETADPTMVCVFEACRDGLLRLTIDDAILLEDRDPRVVIGASCQAILARIHREARFGALIHAAAVAKGDAAIVIAAPSGSGKSTLTAYLVAQGYDYLCDDLVVLRDEDHAVLPFPLPISVKPGAAAALKPFYQTLQADGRQDTQLLAQHMDFSIRPRRARLLLFPRYQAGAATACEEISVADALVRLLADRIFFGCPIPPDVVASFVAWLSKAERRALVYSDFSEAERAIDGVLGG